MKKLLIVLATIISCVYAGLSTSLAYVYGDEKENELIIQSFSLNEAESEKSPSDKVPALNSVKLTSGDYTYSVSNKQAKITKYNGSATTLTIPSSLGNYPVTSIGVSAFSGCSSISSLTIPSSVKSIEWSAFYGCRNLKTLKIGSGVTSIGESAFASCTSLTSISIPSNVTSLGPGAFYGCNNATSLSISANIKTISDNAFSGCSKLSSIKIPSGVTKIGANAFSSCSGAKTISISTTVGTIDANAFSGCSSVTAITIPEGVTSIGDNSFNNCSSAVSLSIPSTLTEIGGNAFSGCSSLERIEVNGNNNVYDSRENCNALVKTDTNVLIMGCQNTVVPEGITAIGDSAFKSAIKLSSLSIPDSVNTIGAYAFENCEALSSITIPGSVTSIGEYAFKGCKSITALAVPENLTAIESHLFDGCTSLKSFHIPDSVKTIGEYAFSNCSHLTAIAVPAAVKSIESNTFYNCSSLKTVTLPETLENIGDYAFYQSGITSDFAIPDSVKTIGKYAFYGCRGLTDVTIPYRVTEIGEYTFKNCYYLKNLTFHDAVKTIGQYAFSGTGLTNVTYWGSAYAFTKITIRTGNDELKNATRENKGSYYSPESFFEYRINRDDTVDILGVKVHSDSYVIPKYIEDKPVVRISDFAFRNETYTESIVLPSSIRSIGNSSFEGCTNLKSVSIPEGVTYIGPYAFSECSSLTSIALPETVTHVYYYAFQNCTKLSAVSMSENVTDIEYYAFKGCSSLTEINLPDALTEIDTGTFMNCSSLTEIEIPASVKSIGSSAFKGCTSIREITVPDNVSIIGSAAFKGCTGLENIQLPNKLNVLDSELFSGCMNLEELTLPDSLTQIYNQVINRTSITSLTVPEGVEYINYQAFENTSLRSIYLPETIKTDSSNTYLSFTANQYLEDIYYSGSESMWNQLTTYIPTYTTVHFAKKSLTSLSITEGSSLYIDLSKGVSAYQLNLRMYPLDAAAQTTVRWTSSNPEAIEVDQNGKLTPLKQGQSVITVTADVLKAECVVSAVNSDTYHEQNGYSLWPSNAAFPSIAGKYYLGCDCFTKEKGTVWTVPQGETILCLNGYELESANLTPFQIIIPDGSTLTIEDCSEGQTGFLNFYEQLYDSTGYGFATVKPGIIVQTGGVLNITSGKVGTGSNRNYYDAELIHLDGGTVNLSGGLINYSTYTNYPNNSMTAIGGTGTARQTGGKILIRMIELDADFTQKGYGISVDGTIEVSGGTIEFGRIETLSGRESKYKYPISLNGGHLYLSGSQSYTGEISIGSLTEAVTAGLNGVPYTGKASILVTNPDRIEPIADGIIEGVNDQSFDVHQYRSYYFYGVPHFIYENRLYKGDNTVRLLSLDHNELALGNTPVSLTASVTDWKGDSVEDTVTWSSAKPEIATVDANGLVTPVSNGTTVVKAVLSDGKTSASCNVTVSLPVEGVELSEDSLVLGRNEIRKLTATVKPETAGNKKVKWESDDSLVARVDQNGNVTGVSEGTTVVRVITEDGGKTASCTVSVYVPVEKLELDKTELSLIKGSTASLTATITPDDASNKNVVWKSSDESVAAVDQNGLITAVEMGSATISVTTEDGTITAECAVEVTSDSYTVTFDSNGGTGQMDPQEIKIGESVNLSANQFVKESDTETLTIDYVLNYDGGENTQVTTEKTNTYAFGGWADSASETKKYDDGELITPEDDMALYAVWNPAASVSPVILPSAERGTFELEGWYSDASCNASYKVGNPGDSYTPDQSAVLYANWTHAPVTITWKNADGSVIDTTTAEYGTLPEHADAQREPDAQYTYTFAGWTPAITEATQDTEYTATYTAELNRYTVTWKNHDGTVLETDENVIYGTKAAYDGETPVKEGDAHHSYAFSGWSPAVEPITGDTEYTAQFEESVNTYHVTWVDDDGTVLRVDDTAYGTVPYYGNVNPYREADAEYTYSFIGWEPEVTEVTGDVTYKACYSAEKNRYTVTWLNWDDSVLKSEELEYGAVPDFGTELPVRPSDEEFNYFFSTWEPAVVPVAGEAVYKAAYTNETAVYTVTWMNGDQVLLTQENVEYGTTVSYEGEAPYKDPTEDKVYTFKGWSPSDMRITGDTVFSAQFDEETRQYPVVWRSEDGSEIRTDYYAYGSIPVFTGQLPEKGSTEQYTFAFGGWTPALSSVTGDAEYTALFTETVRSYPISWVNDDGTLLKSEEVAYGEMPQEPETKPEKESSVQYDYSFKGWNSEIIPVTGARTYMAAYSASLRNYTVTWNNWDGTELKTEPLPYGTMPKYDGTAPVKADDEIYTYTFENWTPSVMEVTGDAVYTAVFSQKEKIIPVSGVELSRNSLSLTKGDRAVLTAAVSPANATNRQVIWSSSNAKIASVDSNGNVTAVGGGTAAITAKTADGGMTAVCQVTVSVPVTGVKLNKTGLTLDKGKTAALAATVTPSDASNKKVTWTSSNTKVAAVDAKGKVTAKAAGTAVITVTTADGNKTAECRITVKNPVIAVTSVRLNKTGITLEKGKTSGLTATVNPSNATNKKVTWSSSNTKVVTVDKKGRITAKAKGTANITVTTADGSKKATCKVTVKETKPAPTKDPAACTTNGFCSYNGKDYWFENGVRQGTVNDPNGVIGDGTVRGREIFDPATGAWYWLDAAYDGAKAVGKEVWMPYIYQDEKTWKNDTKRMNDTVNAINSYSEASGPTSDMGEQVRKAIQKGTGKWVRYDENGKMMKGWVRINTPELIALYPGQKGNTYFYDYATGLMAKGWTTIGGQRFFFDETSGVLRQ